ncbi:hypothetical protein EZH24_09770, partial [Brachyspira catarrhinii]
MILINKKEFDNLFNIIYYIYMPTKKNINKNDKSDYKNLKAIRDANKKAFVFVISFIIAGLGIIIFLFYYFLYSDLERAKNK